MYKSSVMHKVSFTPYLCEQSMSWAITFYNGLCSCLRYVKKKCWVKILIVIYSHIRLLMGWPQQWQKSEIGGNLSFHIWKWLRIWGRIRKCHTICYDTIWQSCKVCLHHSASIAMLSHSSVGEGRGRPGFMIVFHICNELQVREVVRETLIFFYCLSRVCFIKFKCLSEKIA